jgi:ABC-type lipoprotein release transport system permease subunit
MELIKIAWRNIWRSRTRSLIVIIAVSIGMIGGTFSTAVMIGAINQRVDSAINNEVSHAQIHHPKFVLNQDAEFYIDNTDELIQDIESVEEVKATSPRLKITGMGATAESTTGINIIGVIPEKEMDVSGISNLINEGGYFSEKRKNQIIISKRLAENLNLNLKSKIILTFLDNESNVTGGAFRVSGIYQTDNKIFDEMNVFVRKTDLHNLTMYNKNISHEIAILFNDNNAVDAGIEKLMTVIGSNYLLESWKEIQPDLAIMTMMVEKFASYVVVIILLALSFGIINTMLMSILERKKELGMLMAIGMNKKRIRRMITWETTFLTSFGAFIGIVIAQALISYFGVHGINLGAYAEEGFEALGFSAVLYPSLNTSFYIQVVVLIFITSFISNIFPVRMAIKMNPAEVLRTV